ncbi:lipid-binding protein [uncultured Algibacter sp.]|uniref:lipid-binding protein n=1 Tax=uncultured Algibacter sp. TaxID=298659 RepID=UPI0026144DD1|nr:lipid-binding protein [uncultured Algibacter sp.]
MGLVIHFNINNKYNIMKKNFKYIVVILFVAAFTSCETEEGYEDFPVEKTSVNDMTGDWYVQTFIGDDLALGYELITISNTANDESAIQIFDHKNIWWFNTAVPANVGALSFEGNDLASDVDGYQITVNVTNGQIEKNGTVTSDTNLPADFISFDIEFSDDPGTIYHIEGYKRSGFLEDEH